jgi:glutathione S-transferase
MKLYWGPHTCAIGIHILLEQAGATFELEKLDVAGGETHDADFMKINPKGKVPTLVRDDGTVLTEFGAIGTWIAQRYPDAELWPDDIEAEARASEILAYVEGTVHGQGFTRIFKPDFFEPQDMLHGTLGLGRARVEAQGREIVERAFSILDMQLAGTPFAVGETMTVADAALFYVERWAPDQDISLPSHVKDHFERMLALPSVQKVRAMWGEA